MADFANDKFGFTFFRDDSGKILLSRNSAIHSSEKIKDTTVNTCVSATYKGGAWYQRPEFKKYFSTGMVTGSGTGAVKSTGKKA